MITFSSCNQQGISTNKTVESAATDYYKDMYNWKDGETTDQRAFIHYNRAEILKTLEISEVKNIKEKDLAVAFTRFSIGTTVVRQTIWFRRIKDNWTKVLVKPQDYDYEYIGYSEKTPELEKMFSEIKKWEADNPKVWWLKYWN